MGNTSGKIARKPSAQATIKKNATAVATQSPKIIPFYNYFNRGGKSTSIQPMQSWLTRS
jgi:hypothetical protein